MLSMSIWKSRVAERLKPFRRLTFHCLLYFTNSFSRSSMANTSAGITVSSFLAAPEIKTAPSLELMKDNEL